MPQQQLLRLFPEPTARLSVEEVYANLDLPPGEPGRPYTVINAVGTLDGRGAVGGKSTPIGSAVDHRLMRNIRANVDAVLVGAGTLRSEDLTLTVDEPLTQRRRERGLKEQPLSIILTGSGEIPADRKIFQAGGGDVLVFAGANASQENLEKLPEVTIRTSTDTIFPEPEKILETLAKEFGVRRLLVEGGPTMNHSFLGAWLVDEVFLTIVPKIVGGDPRSLVDAEPLPQDATSPILDSIYLSDYSELYLRYRLTHRLGPRE